MIKSSIQLSVSFFILCFGLGLLHGHCFAAIVNGVETDKYVSVVVVQNQRGGRCSATAVSDTTLVTAAHCVSRFGEAVLKVGQTESLKVLAGSEVDVAVAVFPEGTFKDAFSPILDRSPVAGDDLTLVGFGESDFIGRSGDFGTKRVGYNKLTGFATHKERQLIHATDFGTLLHYRSPASLEGLNAGERAMTGRGDSGGPVFIDDKLAGVVSMGETRPNLFFIIQELVNEPEPDDSLIYEYDTNLLSDVAQKFLHEAQETLEGAPFLTEKP